VRTADLEAKEMALKMRGELEQETRTRQKEIQDVERRVLQQEEQLARRLDQLDRRESELQTRDRALGERDKVVSASEARRARPWKSSAASSKALRGSRRRRPSDSSWPRSRSSLDARPSSWA